MKRIKAIVLSTAVLFALSGFALAQDRDHDRDRDDQNKNKGQDARRDAHHDGFVRGYQAGEQAGRSDRGHSRRNGGINDTDGYSRNMGPQGQYKKGYREGYHEGYERAYRNDQDYGRRGDNDRDRDGDRDRDRDRNGNWNGNGGQGGYGGQNNDVAYRTGYQDGVTVGQNDKRGNHSYNPHGHDQSYGNADHNYSQVGGDKNAYKQRYRQGFDAGYARGYNGR